MEIGKMLRQKRTDLNLTQEDIAKQFNVTRQTVSRWENELSYPNIDTLVELSIFFEFSLDEILRGDSVMVKDFAQKVNMSKKYKGWKIATLCLTLLISIFVLNYFSPSMDIGKDDVDSVTVTKSKDHTNVEVQLSLNVFEQPEVWEYYPDLEDGKGIIEVSKRIQLQAIFNPKKRVNLEILNDFLSDKQTIKIKNTNYIIDLETGTVTN